MSYRRRTYLLVLFRKIYVLVGWYLRIVGVAPNILLSSCNGRLMFLPWSFLISAYSQLLNINCKRKSFTFYIISVSKGRFIEQVLTDIWIDFMFIVTLKYPVSITSLNRKQPHVLSFGSCIVGGRTT